MAAQKENPIMFIVKNGTGYVTGITDQGIVTTSPNPAQARVFQEPMRLLWEGLENYEPITVKEVPTQAKKATK